MADLYDVIQNVVNSVEKGDGIPPVEPTPDPEPDAGDGDGDEGNDEPAGDEGGEGDEGVEEPDGEGDGDADEEPEGDDEGEADDEADPDSGGKPKVEEPKLESDETDKLLESLGIRAPKEGERENRLPHSRVRKIVFNAVQKIRQEHQSDLSRRAVEAQKLVVKANEWDRFNGLMTTDADKFMALLSAAYPIYKKFTTQPQQVAALVDEKGPLPDVKLEDGSFTYSAEQWAKREAWVVTKATSDAEARLKSTFDERLAPFEKEANARKINETNLSNIQAQIARAEQQWGELFRVDYKKGKESEILKYMRDMQAAGTPIPFDYAVTQVLLPKVQIGRDQMRTEVLKEFNDRKKAARKPAAAGAGQTKTAIRENRPATPPDGVDPVTFAIQNAVKSSGLK